MCRPPAYSLLQLQRLTGTFMFCLVGNRAGLRGACGLASALALLSTSARDVEYYAMLKLTAVLWLSRRLCDRSRVLPLTPLAFGYTQWCSCPTCIRLYVPLNVYNLDMWCCPPLCTPRQRPSEASLLSCCNQREAAAGGNGRPTDSPGFPASRTGDSLRVERLLVRRGRT